MSSERMQVGLNIGPSFAELCAIKTAAHGPPQFQARNYSPKEPLKDLLKKFRLSLPSNLAIDSIHFDFRVQLRFLEKIFPSPSSPMRLGGSVAQIVTQGFEDWPSIRQPIASNYLTINSAKQDGLAARELVFGIHERVNSEGKIIQNVNVDELQQIAKTLKAQNIQKICVNLLFSHLNSQNQNLICSFLRESGFEVFSRTRSSDSPDEVKSWRSNILNASLAGTFLEIDREIREAISTSFPEISTIHLRYLHANGSLDAPELQKLVEILFGWTSLLPNKKVVYLGLEKWSLLSGDSSPDWRSPWGLVEVEHKNFIDLPIQPTSLLEKDFFDECSWGHPQGFEPGPMSFGRAQKPLVFDALLLLFPEATAPFSQLITTQGQNRFQEALHLLEKNCKLKSSLESIRGALLSTIFFLSASEEILLSGFWAPFFLPELKKSFPNIHFAIAEQLEEARHVAELA